LDENVDVKPFPAANSRDFSRIACEYFDTELPAVLNPEQTQSTVKLNNLRRVEHNSRKCYRGIIEQIGL
jgi:hypothetical protein